MPMLGPILMIEVAALHSAFLIVDVFAAIPRGAIVDLDEAAVVRYVFECLGEGMVTAIAQAASSWFW